MNKFKLGNNSSDVLLVTGSVLISGSLLIAGSTPTYTTGTLRVFADGDNGNDSNSGLYSWEPKKTLSSVFNLVPFNILHNTCVHLTGNFVEAASPGSYLERYVDANAKLVVDGGNQRITLDGDYVADISSTSTIGLSTLSWGLDNYMGLLVEILDGPAIGQTRMIQSNTSTTITVSRNFSVNPGAATFRISRPYTTISGSSGHVLTFGNYGSNDGSNKFNVQNLFITGSTTLVTNWNSNFVYYSHIISAVSGSSKVAFYGNTVTANFKINSSSFATEGSATFARAGLSHISGTMNSNVQVGVLARAPYLTLQSLVANSFICFGVQTLDLAAGSRVNKLILSRTGLPWLIDNIYNSSNCPITKIGSGSDGGLFLSSSFISIGAIDISDCGKNAINCRNSYLQINGVTTGTGNGDFACYAHDNSNIVLKSIPTLTGSKGYITTDGSSEISNWSDIYNVTDVNDLNEMTIIKKLT
jgi:hypothetical protein